MAYAPDPDRRPPLPEGWVWGLAILLAVVLAFVFGTSTVFSLISVMLTDA